MPPHRLPLPPCRLKIYPARNIWLIGAGHTRRKTDKEVLEEIVRTDNKQRYSYNEGKTLIRANQGHSISVDVELKEQKLSWRLQIKLENGMECQCSKRLRREWRRMNQKGR